MLAETYVDGGCDSQGFGAFHPNVSSTSRRSFGIRGSNLLSLSQMANISSSSRIFSRRAFSSGVRFFLAMCYTSCVMLLFYTSREVYTKFGTVSFDAAIHVAFPQAEIQNCIHHPLRNFSKQGLTRI